MRRALLIIDMQVGLVPAVKDGDQLVARLNALVSAARGVGVPVIFLQQDGPPGSRTEPHTPGWEIDPRVGREPGDLTLRKTATDSFYRTRLLDELSERAIDTVVIAGVATDYCVDATVRAALSHDLDVQLVRDGHSTSERSEGMAADAIIDHHNRVLGSATHPGGHVELALSTMVFASR